MGCSVYKHGVSLFSRFSNSFARRGGGQVNPPPYYIDPQAGREFGSVQSKLLKGVLTVMRVAEIVPVSVTATLPSVLWAVSVKVPE